MTQTYLRRIRIAMGIAGGLTSAYGIAMVLRGQVMAGATSIIAGLTLAWLGLFTIFIEPRQPVYKYVGDAGEHHE